MKRVRRLVAEILPHKDEIDPKYTFLFSAPVADDDGLPTVIRYSRKTAEIYVQSEEEGKATGWKSFYEGGKWVSQGTKSSAKKKATKKKAKKKVTKKKAKKVTKKKASKKTTYVELDLNLVYLVEFEVLAGVI